jgi:toxin ParE1/3/4
MSAYRLSPLAEDDLEGIWVYTVEKWSITQADRYYSDIVDTLEELASGNLRGRVTGIRTGYLKYPVGRHFIFFLSSEAGIDVIRILHQSMDIERHL